MNKIATYIAARTAKAVKEKYSRQAWCDHRLKIIRVLTDLSPNKPDDGVAGFLAYDVDGHSRMKMRTGRFLTRKLKLNNNFLPDTSIQTIAAQINTKLFGNADEIRLDSGERITRNYQSNVGGSSCMSGDSAEYTRLYADNPDKIKQLVMVSVNDSARAIVHVLDNGQYHMSRVYSTSEELKERMRNYACDKGWLVSAGEDKNMLIVSDLDYTDGEIPYADSLTGYRINSKGLTMVHTSLDHDGILDSTCGELNDNKCCCCGESISEDDSYDEEGEIYCESCHDATFTRCGHCDEVYNTDDCTYVESTKMSVCRYCLERHYACCEDCGDYFKTDDTHTVDDKTVCNNCLEKYTFCDECKTYHNDDDCVWTEEWNEVYCDGCLNEIIESYVSKDCEGQRLLSLTK